MKKIDDLFDILVWANIHRLYVLYMLCPACGKMRARIYDGKVVPSTHFLVNLFDLFEKSSREEFVWWPNGPLFILYSATDPASLNYEAR